MTSDTPYNMHLCRRLVIIFGVRLDGETRYLSFDGTSETRYLSFEGTSETRYQSVEGTSETRFLSVEYERTRVWCCK